MEPGLLYNNILEHVITPIVFEISYPVESDGVDSDEPPPSYDELKRQNEEQAESIHMYRNVLKDREDMIEELMKENYKLRVLLETDIFDHQRKFKELSRLK